MASSSKLASEPLNAINKMREAVKTNENYTVFESLLHLIDAYNTKNLSKSYNAGHQTLVFFNLRQDWLDFLDCYL